MVLLAFLIAGTAWGFHAIPKGFLPVEDTGQVLMFTQAAQGISYDAMVAHQKVLNGWSLRDPNVLTYFSSVGAGGPSGTMNSSIMFASLVPRSQRKEGVDQIINRWRGEFSSIPGMMMFLQNPPPIHIGAQFTKSTYQMTLQSPNTTDLYKYSTHPRRRSCARCPICATSTATSRSRIRKSMSISIATRRMPSD